MMEWDVVKMDRSFLFRRILQPLTERVFDAFDKILEGRLTRMVIEAEIRLADPNAIFFEEWD